MDYKPCLPEIRNRYGVLTPAEKRLADYILEYPSETVQLSAAALAARANTASSAVIRLCRSLGFGGFSEFKMNLAVELSQNVQFSYMPGISPEDSSGDILDKIFAANVKTLQDTARKLDRSVFDAVVQLLCGASNIYVYGVGTSAGIAADLQYRLMLLGCSAFLFTDVPSMSVSTINLHKGDVAIGVSHSGRTIATVDTLRRARESGAATVCITSYGGSLIARVCDQTLTVYSDETKYPIEAVSARVAQLGVIDALIAAISARRYSEAVQRSENIHSILNTLRYPEGKR